MTTGVRVEELYVRGAQTYTILYCRSDMCNIFGWLLFFFASFFFFPSFFAPGTKRLMEHRLSGESERSLLNCQRAMADRRGSDERRHSTSKALFR